MHKKKEISLDLLPKSATGVLSKPRIYNKTVLRLLELGLTEGAEITIKRKGPFGDPIQAVIRNSCICIHKKEASYFRVKLNACEY